MLRILPLIMGVLAFTANAAETVTFSVTNQYSLTKTAAYWNPILQAVSKETGVQVELKVGKTAPETLNMALAGETDIFLTNHLFSPERQKLGWSVVGRIDRKIHCVVAAMKDSGMTKLEDLDGKPVGFPSKEAFVAHKVPHVELSKRKVKATPVFTAGQQESNALLLKSGKVVAVALNNKAYDNLVEKLGEHNLAVLWKSSEYNDLALMTKPGASAAARKVAKAIVDLGTTPAGIALFKAQAEIISADVPEVIVKSSDADYANYLAIEKAVAGH